MGHHLHHTEELAPSALNRSKMERRPSDAGLYSASSSSAAVDAVEEERAPNVSLSTLGSVGEGDGDDRKVEEILHSDVSFSSGGAGGC